MARKMAPVPESWLHRNFDAEPSKEPDQNDKTTVEVFEPKDQDATQLERVSDVLPKCFRSRARIILNYLEGRIHLNGSQRVVYENSVTGSHIVDLLRYFLSAFVKQRPKDAPMFEKLMKKAGVPDSVYVQRGGARNIAANRKPLK
jgi:translation initiation factor 2 beta subunit (eIF-2beta)/eIF-5